MADLGKGAYYTWNSQPLYYKGFRVKGHSRSQSYKGLKNLQSRGLITEISEDQYKFTKKGKIWL